jgi:hypothetical protein
MAFAQVSRKILVGFFRRGKIRFAFFLRTFCKHFVMLANMSKKTAQEKYCSYFSFREPAPQGDAGSLPLRKRFLAFAYCNRKTLFAFFWCCSRFSSALRQMLFCVCVA